MSYFLRQWSLIVVAMAPEFPAGQTFGATLGSQRWPGPGGKLGSVVESACSAGSQPPGGCRQCGWPQLLGYLSHQILVQPPVNIKHRVLEGSTEKQSYRKQESNT